jgi:hypothetical protein
MVIRTCTGHRRLSRMDMDPSTYIKRRLIKGSVECAISVMDDRMTYQDTIDRVIGIGAPRYRITLSYNLHGTKVCSLQTYSNGLVRHQIFAMSRQKT